MRTREGAGHAHSTALRTSSSSILPSEDLKGPQRLLDDDRRHAVAVQGVASVGAQVLHELLGGSDVAAHGTEGLCKGAHHDVNVGRVNASVLTAPTPALVGEG